MSKGMRASPVEPVGCKASDVAQTETLFEDCATCQLSYAAEVNTQ